MLKIQVHDVDCTPSTAYDNAAAIDLKIAQDLFLNPGETAKVSLGVAIELDENTAGLIIPRSSCSGFVLTNTVGLIDPDYRGLLFAKIRSVSHEPIFFPKGERLLQLMVVPFIPGFTIVDELNNNTARGSRGDGSSGKN